MRRLLDRRRSLALLGIARIVAGVPADAPIGCARRDRRRRRRRRDVLARRAARRRRRAAAATSLKRLRATRTTTCGASPWRGQSALAAALFGGGALWLAEPAIASALGVPREDAAALGSGGTRRRRRRLRAAAAAAAVAAAAAAAAADAEADDAHVTTITAARPGRRLAPADRRRARARRAGSASSRSSRSRSAPRALPAGVAAARERGLQVVPHGISLSLGGAERPDRARLAHLASVAERVGAPLVSEHIAFVRAGGREAGHLLPVPRTREALEILSENVAIAQEALPVPLALEHVAALVEWPGAEMDEATFVARADRAHGRAAAARPLQPLRQRAQPRLRRARGARRASRWTGSPTCTSAAACSATASTTTPMPHPVVPGVLHLVEELFALADAPGVLLERDDDFPPEAELVAELRAIADAARWGSEHRVRA